MMTSDQVRLACQADAFLTHLVNERFRYLGLNTQWHVGFHPKPEGVEMHLGLKVNAESFVVRRPFPPLTPTSGIYYGCVEMIDTLRKSVDKLFPPDYGNYFDDEIDGRDPAYFPNDDDDTEDEDDYPRGCVDEFYGN